MRIAIFSDIHGNVISLKAVLAHIEKAQIDKLICLGDVATMGPRPKETVSLLRQLECTFIMGNHDEYVLDPEVGRSYMDAEWFVRTICWGQSQLSEDDLAFIRAFLPFCEFKLPNGDTMLCYHGSPKSNTDILLPMTPPTSVDNLIGYHPARIMVGGHTHIQMMRQHKGKLLINAGSVGMPFEQALFIHAPRLLPWAEYVIVHADEEKVSAELVRVPIDLAAVKESALTSTHPEKEEWAGNWMSPSEIR